MDNIVIKQENEEYPIKLEEPELVEPNLDTQEDLTESENNDVQKLPQEKDFIKKENEDYRIKLEEPELVDPNIDITDDLIESKDKDDQRPPQGIEFVKCESISDNNHELEHVKCEPLSKDDQQLENINCEFDNSDSGRDFDFAEFVKKNASLIERKCFICSKVCSKRSLIITHMKVHARLKKFECSICDEKFIANNDLKHHIHLKHSNVRDFKCLICDKTFATKQNLRKHTITHTSKFECKICHKSYARLNLLILHMRKVHLGIVYKCEFCCREFANQLNLDAHMKEHTVTNACGVCKKVYKSKISLHKHVRYTSCKNGPNR